jgi:hypothetical protein
MFRVASGAIIIKVFILLASPLGKATEGSITFRLFTRRLGNTTFDTALPRLYPLITADTRKQLSRVLILMSPSRMFWIMPGFSWAWVKPGLRQMSLVAFFNHDVDGPALVVVQPSAISTRLLWKITFSIRAPSRKHRVKAWSAVRMSLFSKRMSWI